MVGGKLLSAELTAKLSMMDADSRQLLVDRVVRILHRKRRRAHLEYKRSKRPEIARID